MIITLPHIRPGRAMEARAFWACPDRMLPEAILCGTIRIDPSPKVVVQSVSFQTCGVKPDEPWVIVWVTVDVPDDLVEPFDFTFVNPKQRMKRVTRETPDELAARVSESMKSKLDLAGVMADNAKRMADAEPDEAVR